MALGDTPLFLRNCVMIEGEVFWKVLWASRHSFKLLGSFETQDDLEEWNSTKFD